MPDLHIFTDFDGTITDTDSLVFLTRELGGGLPLLAEVGQQLRANQLTLREGIELEMSTVRATFEEARKLLLEKISVDPCFTTFVEWVRIQKIPMTVLSAGFHEIIELFVPSHEFPDLEILASRINPVNTGWRCVFRDDSDYGNDKALAIQEARDRGAHTIFIGDGLSDRASAEVADTIFAKRYLAEYCRQKNIDCIEFQSFAEILQYFQAFERNNDLFDFQTQTATQ